MLLPWSKRCGFEVPAEFADNAGVIRCGRRGIAPLAIIGRAI